MATLAEFPETMCVLTLHALLEQSVGTNPDVGVYINKHGTPRGSMQLPFAAHGIELVCQRAPWF